MAIEELDTLFLVKTTIESIPESDYNLIVKHGGVTINKMLDTKTQELEGGLIWLGDAQAWSESGEWKPTINLNDALTSHKLPDTLLHELAHIILDCEEVERVNMVAPLLYEFKAALPFVRSLMWDWDSWKREWKKDDGHKSEWKKIYCRISGKSYPAHRVDARTPISSNDLTSYRDLPKFGTLGKFATEELTRVCTSTKR